MRTTVSSLLAVTLALGLVAGCNGGSSTRSSEDNPNNSSEPVQVNRQFFGVHDSDPVASWPNAPVGSLRVWDAGAAWSQIETSPGVFDFNPLNAIVATARAHKSDTLIVLGQTPLFYASKPSPQASIGAGASSMPKLDAWRKYVEAMVRQFDGPDVQFQVWNEANVINYWSGTPAQMAQLTAVARKVIDKIDPDLTLVAPAFVTRLPAQRRWMDDFYSQKVDGKPVGDLVDVVSLQLYPAAATPTPEAAVAELQVARQILAKHGVDKPVWNTEANYGAKGGKFVKPASADEQAAKVAQTYLLDAAYGVRRVYWYAWNLTQAIVDTFLVEADQITPTAAGRALSTVHDWMIGRTVTSCRVDSHDTYTCTLVRGKEKRYVLWNSDRTVQVDVPSGMTSAQQLTGEKRAVKSGSSVTVGAMPVLVRSGRSAS